MAVTTIVTIFSTSRITSFSTITSTGRSTIFSFMMICGVEVGTTAVGGRVVGVAVGVDVGGRVGSGVAVGVEGNTQLPKTRVKKADKAERTRKFLHATMGNILAVLA